MKYPAQSARRTATKPRLRINPPRTALSSDGHQHSCPEVPNKPTCLSIQTSRRFRPTFVTFPKRPRNLTGSLNRGRALSGTPVATAELLLLYGRTRTPRTPDCRRWSPQPLSVAERRTRRHLHPGAREG